MRFAAYAVTIYNFELFLNKMIEFTMYNSCKPIVSNADTRLNYNAVKFAESISTN